LPGLNIGKQNGEPVWVKLMFFTDLNDVLTHIITIQITRLSWICRCRYLWIYLWLYLDLGIQRARLQYECH